MKLLCSVVFTGLSEGGGGDGRRTGGRRGRESREGRDGEEKVEDKKEVEYSSKYKVQSTKCKYHMYLNANIANVLR